MKKYLPKILSVALILIAGVVILLPQTAHANLTDTIISYVVPQSSINSVLRSVANLILMFVSGLVTISGTFLSMSMNITTHIKDIYNGISGIESTWRTIRDLSSIVIIFALLYASIKMILGTKGANFGQLVVKIFIAGMLINFSLFFVKIAVDASNLVSLQFYNAIAPETASNWTTTSAFYDGGISNVFMQSLNVPAIYKSVDFKSGSDVSLSIIFTALGGSIMMIAAAFSFFAAAIAFTVRTAMLLAIMVISPLYFACLIFPKLEEKVSKKISGLLYSQCVFMPIYLFLMYIALKIISDKNFLAVFNTANNNAAAGLSGGFFGSASISLILQFTIAIVFINFPLVAAISMGGIGMKWAPTAADISKKVGGFFGRRTLGWAGQKALNKFDEMEARDRNTFGVKFMRTIGANQAIRGGLAGLEGGKYGGKQSLKERQEDNKKRAKVLATDANEQERQAVIRSVVGGNYKINPLSVSYVSGLKPFRDTLGKMSAKDLEKLKPNVLADKMLASNLSSKQAEGIMEGDIDPQDKDKFATARKEGLQEVFSSSNEANIGEHVKKLSGKDLAKMVDDIKTNPNVLKFIAPSHLRDMEDLNIADKRQIAGEILKDQSAKGFGFFQVQRNQDLWGL